MLNTPSCVVVILAAGKGKRMHSKATNKVVLPVLGKPLIAYTLKHLHAANFSQIIAVVGFAARSVKEALGKEITYVTQAKRLGTGHAVAQAIKVIPPHTHTVMTMYGDDSAFYPPALYTEILQNHRRSRAVISLLTVKVNNPAGLGRIVRDSNGKFIAIVEEKNASENQKKITEINTGLFCFDYSFLRKNLKNILKNPISGEYYLTDLVEIAVSQNHAINTFSWPDPFVWHGVNTPQQLAEIRQRMES